MKQVYVSKWSGWVVITVLCFFTSIGVANDIALPVTSGLKLWLDASQLQDMADGDQVDVWQDSSGNGNHATRMEGSAAGYPKFKENILNGHSAILLNPDGSDRPSSFYFNRITDIRSVYWVLRESLNAEEENFLLGDYDKYDFHRGRSRKIWDSNWANGNVKNGKTKLMGSVVNGAETAVPGGVFQILSLSTMGNVHASQVTKDRKTIAGNRSWQGEIAEIVIYNRVLSMAENNEVGLYLSQKYGLEANYESDPAKILNFQIEGVEAEIKGNNINCGLPEGSDLTMLAPTYSLSSVGACGYPASGTVQDFSTPVEYKIISEDLTITNVYSVSISTMPITINVNYSYYTSYFTMNNIYSWDVEARAAAEQVAPSPYYGSCWNDETRNSDLNNGITIANLRDSQGNLTGISTTVKMLQGPWNQPGEWEYDGSMKLLRTGQTGGNGQTDYHDMLTITNLDTDHCYDLYIISRSIATAKTYFKHGDKVRDIVPSGETVGWVEGANYLLFNKLVPDVTGTITIYAKPESPGRYNLTLNGFQLVPKKRVAGTLIVVF